MSPWRRRLRRLRRWTVGLLAAAVIVLGLLVAVLSRLLPMLDSRPEQVAQWLSNRIGLPVAVHSARGEWTGRGLQFELGGLRLGAGNGVQIERAVLQIRVFAGLLPGEPLTSLQLRAPSIKLERLADGRWQVEGLGAAATATPDLSVIERLGEVVLDGASLQVRDPSRAVDWTLDRVDARMRSARGTVRLGLRAYQERGAAVEARLELSNELRDGRVHLQLPDSDLAPWLAAWVPAEWQRATLRLNGQLWLRLIDGEIDTVRFDTGVGGRPTPTDDGPVAAASPDILPTLAMRGEWRREADGWQLRAEGDDDGWLQLTRRGAASELVASGWTLQRWLPWALLHPQVSLAQRAQWLARQPRGTLDGLRLRWDEAAPLQLAARVGGLGLAPLGKQPGFQGLDFSLDGIGERVAISVRAPRFGFDWPVGLRGPMTPAVNGELLLWRDDDAARSWCLSALDLRLAEPDYGLRAAGDVCFDGGAPRLDLQVAVAPVDITVAKRFWIMHTMPPPAVNWLDAALQSGQLRSGRVQLTGDLADWPFVNGGGRFEAIAELQDLNLKFRPDWPAAEQLGGVARFINNGMEVELAAQVQGVRVTRATGGIPRFRDSRLLLQIEGEAGADAVLALLRNSPLWKNLAASLAPMSMLGPAGLQLALDIPLKKEAGPASVDGRVELRDVDLRHADWGIAFDAARGDVRFTERGVRVEAMQVLHVGRPAEFSLAVNSFASDPANAVEAGLRGRLDADALIDSQPELHWLKSYLQGTSAWEIDLQVAAVGGRVPKLQLRSDLVGTELQLPAPLRKSEAVPMPLDLRLELAAEAKSVDLKLGELLRLRGLLRRDEPFNGLAEFGDAHGDQRPPRGIAVIGQVPVLDTSGWLGMAVGGGDGLLHSVQLQCGELDVLGRSFAETGLRFRRESGDQRVEFSGPMLQGEIEIPALEEIAQRGITARFERLHWPSSEEDASPTAGLDPRLVPALHVLARDLRLGAASLGETRLESFPTADGMRIEQFSARSDALELSARGDWHRVGALDQSQFDVEFTAQDLGGMLRALGFAEFVEGGQTLATLRARWPGPPASFGLDKSSGELVLSVGKGRIPDVSPGAGRLFGLLSLAEIPRRLALDFSDFFRSGLAFNKIEGSFALDAGLARTESLLIDSPAAEIRIRGETDLRQQRYAQTMEVLPRAGSVLPVVGALAGGPAGAALGAVAQAVLQKPFKQISRTLYRVQGPWSKPEIEVIERGPARGSAPRGDAPPPPP